MRPWRSDIHCVNDISASRKRYAPSVRDMCANMSLILIISRHILKPCFSTIAYIRARGYFDLVYVYCCKIKNSR